MSASREKKMRAERQQRGEEPQKHHRTQAGGLIKKRLAVVAAVLVVLVLAGLYIYGLGLPQRYITAMTVEGKNLSVVELNYYYVSNAFNFLNQYGEMFVQYGMLDPNQYLADQDYDEGQSWADYIMNGVMSSLSDIMLFGNLAESEGISLTQWDKDRIDRDLASLAQYAEAGNVSVNKYLSNVYGRGMTEDILRKCMERERLAARYETTHRESYTFSDAEIQAYYTENAQQFDSVDYRSASFSKLLGDQEFDQAIEAGEDPEAMVDTPLGEMTVENKIAYDKAVQLKDDPALSPDTFNSLAGELAGEDEREAYADDPDHTLQTGASYAESELMDWLYDPARKNGDVTLISEESTFVVAMFLSRDRHEDKTVTARHIFVQTQSDTDSGWLDAETRADDIFRAVQGVSEDEFARKADSDSQDLSADSPGGLYREITPGVFGSDAADDWLFDAGRKSGDVELIQGDYGYHILYFVSQGRPEYQVSAERQMRDADYNEFRSEKVLTAVTPEQKAFGMRMLMRI